MSTKRQAEKDAKEFWQKAKERSKEVDNWPSWKRLETTHRRETEASSHEEAGNSGSDTEEDTQTGR